MMNVYFHANGALIDSPHFHYTFDYPPKGVKYIGTTLQTGDVILDMGIQRLFKSFVSLGKVFLNLTNRSMVNASPLNVRSAPCKLVHSFNTIPITDKPYIIELEAFHALFIGGAKDSRAIKKITNHLTKRNCKAILFWTQNAYDNFNKLMCSPVIKKKSVVLYPGVPLYNQNKSHNVPTIGFIARDFINKGGALVLPTMKDFVTSKRAKAIIVTDIKLLKKDNKKIYDEYKQYIDFKQLMPRNKLHSEIFPKLDVLFYPGYSDTFGYIFPEAMSHGIPIVTINGCARKELVTEKGGCVVNAALNEWGFLEDIGEINKFADLQMGINMCLTNILTDKKLRKAMSDYNYGAVKSGIFSLYNRNEILKQIYMKALK